MAEPRDSRRDVVRVCEALHARGWVANHDGNVTLRLEGNRFLATPTAISKADVVALDLIEVDKLGNKLYGRAKPFGELPMHLAIFEARTDVFAVIHAHPPHATAIACSGENLISEPFIAEAVVSLGAHIPLLPFVPPGAVAAKPLGAVAPYVDAALLENHGVFTWGKDLEQALLRMELVEHLSRIALLSRPLGGPRPLPRGVFADLLAARRKAGLGAAAERNEAPPQPSQG